MTQVVTDTTTSLGASGLGNPGSQFGIKLTTLPDTTTATPPQPSQEQQSLGGVRRSQRVRKKMTKLKTKASNQKHSLRTDPSLHSKSQATSSSRLTSSNQANESAPSRLPTNDVVSSDPTSSSSHNGGGTSSTLVVPQSSDPTGTTTTTASYEGGSSSLTTGDQSTSSVETSALTQTQANSPIQLEHSYALTFSSVAEEIPLLNSQAGYLETPPITTPTSSSTHTISFPVSDRANVPSTSHRVRTSPLPHPQTLLQSGRSLHIGINTGTTSRDLSSGVHPSENSSTPPYMLSSVEPHLAYSTLNHISVPIGHAPNSRLGGTAPMGSESFTTSDRPVSLVSPTVFEVPMPLSLSRYPIATGLQTTAEQLERERQRLENSSAFIVSRSRQRSSVATQRRSRRRRRGQNNEQATTDQSDVANGLMTSSRHHTSRSRSPNRSHLTSSLSVPQESHQQSRNRSSPTPQVLPLPSAVSTNIHVASPSLADHTPQMLAAYQVVPDITRSPLSHTPLPPPLPSLHLPHRQISVPVTSTVQLQFQMIPRLTRNSSEPLVQLTSPQPDLIMSHSGSPFHPLGTSHSAVTMNEASSSSRISSSARLSAHGTARQPSNQVLDSPGVYIDEEQTFPESTVRESREEVSGASRRRDSSHVEVIIVDSSDSEDDDVILSHVTQATPPHRDSQQLSMDEALARRLQTQFDQELLQYPDPPPVAAGPSIPLPRPASHSGSLIRDNYEALVSHIDRLTHNDAMRMLRMTDMHARSRRGRRPRTPAEFARAMESMGETLLVNAIFGAPVVSGTTYEDLLELADTLGPARPQGLSQEEIDRLPVIKFEPSLDSSSSEDQSKCVVCMCEFKETVKCLPCSHKYHKECIDRWLKDHKTCPVCRNVVLCS